MMMMMDQLHKGEDEHDGPTAVVPFRIAPNTTTTSNRDDNILTTTADFSPFMIGLLSALPQSKKQQQFVTNKHNDLMPSTHTLSRTVSPSTSASSSSSQQSKSVTFDNMYLIELTHSSSSASFLRNGSNIDDDDDDDTLATGSGGGRITHKPLSSQKTLLTYTDMTRSVTSSLPYSTDEMDDDISAVSSNITEDIEMDDEKEDILITSTSNIHFGNDSNSSNIICSKKNKVLRFDDECNFQVYTVESFKDIPEASDLYLSTIELDTIRRENDSIVYLMENNHHCSTSSDCAELMMSSTTRGLECYTEDGKWKRYKNIRDATNAVILLQASIEMMHNSYDESNHDTSQVANEIASVYRKETESAGNEAYLIGQNDYEETINHLVHEPVMMSDDIMNNIDSTLMHNVKSTDLHNNVDDVDCRSTVSYSSDSDSCSSDSDSDSETYEDLLHRIHLATASTYIGKDDKDDPSYSSSSDGSSVSSNNCEASVKLCSINEEELSNSPNLSKRCTRRDEADVSTSYDSSSSGESSEDVSSSDYDSDDDNEDDDDTFGCTTSDQTSLQCLEDTKRTDVATGMTSYTPTKPLPPRAVTRSCFQRHVAVTTSHSPDAPAEAFSRQKSVSFSESIVSTVEYVSLLKDIPKDIFADVWWTHEEMLQLRQEYEGVLYMIDQGLALDDEHESARGLEIRTEEGEWKFYEHKRDAWNAVLGIQDDMTGSKSDCIDEAMSVAYIEESARKTREEALQRAINDYEAIQAYMFAF
jgi:hypothetical protein